MDVALLAAAGAGVAGGLTALTLMQLRTRQVWLGRKYQSPRARWAKTLTV